MKSTLLSGRGFYTEISTLPLEFAAFSCFHRGSFFTIMKPTLFVRLALCLALLLITGLAVVPASADCDLVSSNGGDQDYRCSGTVTDPLDVGSGNDSVIIRNGAILANEILSQGGSLLVIVRKDGVIDSPSHAVWMIGDGNIILRGQGAIYGYDAIHLQGNGSIEMLGNLSLYGETVGLWLEGSGNISNAGYIAADEIGILLGNPGDDIEAFLFNPLDTSGTITNDGVIESGIAGLVLVGSGEIANSGYVDGLLIGTLLYGSGEINNSGEINSDVVGILLAGRLPISENGLESLGFDGGGVINNWGEIGTDYMPLVGILLLGDGEINNYEGAKIASQLLGIGLYGNGTINNEARIRETGIGIALIGELSYDDLAPILDPFIGAIFSGQEPDLGGDFLSNLSQIINSINFAGGGTINNSGNIRDVGLGLLLVGNGEINNEGRIVGSELGILMYGNGEINNSGNIRESMAGILGLGQIRLDENGPIFMPPEELEDVPAIDFLEQILGPFAGIQGNVDFEGNIVVNNDARIVENLLGILVAGNGEINNSGRINSDLIGIGLFGNGEINNSGRVNGGGAAILLIGKLGLDEEGNVTFGGGGTINNSGRAKGDMVGIALLGEGAINNSGEAAGSLAAITGIGNVNIVNEGLAVGDVAGILGVGNTNVYNTGSVFGGEAGIVILGNGTVNVADGYVGGGAAAILGDDGNQHVSINGIVDGGNGQLEEGMLPSTVDVERLAIALNGGNDSVTLRTNADVYGDILMGEGDDTVQIISGAQVDGLIDGGGEITEDLLILGEGNYCYEVSGMTDFVNQSRLYAQSINPEGDTFIFDGNTYSIADFERVISGRRLVYCVGMIDDGRINAYDIGAPVAGYCNVEDGVNLWDINSDGSGEPDFSVSGADMRAALEVAVNSGVNQLIAQSPRGNSLWALSSNEYQFMGPDLNEPGKTYVYIFSPDRCGPGAALGN